MVIRVSASLYVIHPQRRQVNVSAYLGLTDSLVRDELVALLLDIPGLVDSDVEEVDLLQDLPDGQTVPSRLLLLLVHL